MKGKVFNMWTVTSGYLIKKDNKVYLECKCFCGEVKEVIVKNLKSGASKNCGCLRRNKTSGRNYVHGLRFTREWRIWRAMKTRCYNKNSQQFKNYGGRGITVCDEWIDSFQSFYSDMGKSPEGSSIDRVDTNGNYCKENCKWSTAKEQCRNKTNNRKYNGECAIEVDERLGGKSGLVSKRLARGWDLTKAITTISNGAKKGTKNRKV